MAGNMNSGRKPTYEAKCVNSSRLSLEASMKLEELAKRLEKSKSEIIREIIERNIEAWHAIIIKEETK